MSIADLMSGHGAAAAPAEEPTIRTVLEGLDSGELSCTQVVRWHLERIEAFDAAGPRLSAILAVNPRAIEVAAELDAARAAGKGDTRPLRGVPVILKDNYATADLPTTAGSVTLAGCVPPFDAFVVSRLRAAGAIVLAKANMTELALTGTTVGSLGGQTLNPWDLTRTPGGSSGGTGAAVAACFGVVGTGTDTFQSTRSPASAGCLVGLRPTRGLVSRSGIVPVSSTQDEAGPITRTVEDAARVLDVIAGHDPADPVTAFGSGRRPATWLELLDARGLRGARLGLLLDFLGGEAIHGEVNAVVREAVRVMEGEGATVVPVRIPDLEGLARDVAVADFELADALGAYLSALGPTAPVRSLAELVARDEAHPAVRPALEAALATGGVTDPEYGRRLLRRGRLRQAVAKVLEEQRLDALLYPHQRRLVVPIGEEQVERNGVLAHGTGFPALAFPGGFSPATPSAPLGVPVGIELLGPPWSEAVLFRLAHAFEVAACVRRPPPTTPLT